MNYREEMTPPPGRRGRGPRQLFIRRRRRRAFNLEPPHGSQSACRSVSDAISPAQVRGGFARLSLAPCFSFFFTLAAVSFPSLTGGGQSWESDREPRNKSIPMNNSDFAQKFKRKIHANLHEKGGCSSEFASQMKKFSKYRKFVKKVVETAARSLNKTRPIARNSAGPGKQPSSELGPVPLQPSSARIYQQPL